MPRDVTEHNMSEPLVNSPETKRLMEIAFASGASVRTAYKTVRKRLRIEARRQKELDGGVEPEVVLDSVLNQMKVEQHQQSGPLKRVFDSRRQSCRTSPCEGQDVASDSVLVDRQTTRYVRGEGANCEWDWCVMALSSDRAKR